jgi:hypothetical protein
MSEDRKSLIEDYLWAICVIVYLYAGSCIWLGLIILVMLMDER